MQQMFLKLHDIEDSERKILSLRLCVENLEMLLLKLGKFLSVLICLARLLILLVQTMNKTKYKYLANSWDCMKLWKIILIGSVLKIFLVN
jgi:hypothetical protein